MVNSIRATVFQLRNHHGGRGICEQIKPSQRALAWGLGCPAHKALDQGDSSYSNTILFWFMSVFIDKMLKIHLECM